jgi:hypothetical protein
MPNSDVPNQFPSNDLTSPIIFFKNAIYFNITYDTAIGKELYKIELFPAAVDDVDKVTFSIYPNPAREEITVEMEEAAEFVVYDVYGKKVIMSKSNKIDISGLATGVYFIEAIQRGRRSYGRFLKNKN